MPYTEVISTNKQVLKRKSSHDLCEKKGDEIEMTIVKIHRYLLISILFTILSMISLYISESTVFAETTEPEAKVFEEPENYNINAMNLDVAEVGQVEDGGTSENDLFDFEAFIKESDIKDGTAPFDTDNDAGNDNGEQNGVVRTFDTMTYPIKITINPKKVDKLNNIVLKITGTLENGISGKQVNAKFSVGGYEDMVKGVVGFEQLYTIEQTGTSIMIPINVDVQGAKNGVSLKPTLKVEVVSVDGVDITKDNVSMDFDQLKAVKTSGKVNIKAYSSKHNYGSNRFLTVPYAVLDPTTDSDKNIFGYSISMGLEKLPGKTDMRGATFPTGKINYHMDLSGYVAWDGGALSGKNQPLSFTKTDKPLYMIDHQPIGAGANNVGNKNTLLEGKSYTFAYTNGHPTARSKLPNLTQKTIDATGPFSVWDSGSWSVNKPTVTDNKVIYTGSMEDYIIGSTFPTYRADGYTGYPQFGVNDKVFATNSYMVDQPNEYVIGGKNNPDGLANNVYYEADVVIDSYVDETGKTIVLNKTAKSISSERNNPSGSMHVQNTFFSYPSSKQLGTPNIGDGTVSKGDVSTILKEDVKFIGYARSSIINYGGADVVVRWNTDAFELTKAYSVIAYNAIMDNGYANKMGTNTKNNPDTEKVYYGVTKFTDNSFENFTAKGDTDYTWYPDFESAIKNGPIGGIKISVNDVLGASTFLQWNVPLHVKTTKIGSYTDKGSANITVTNLYSYPTADRKTRVDVSNGKSYQNPAIWSEVGQLEKKQAPAGSTVNFETLAVLNAETASTITSDKQTYYNSEKVSWLVKNSIVLPATGAPSGFDGSVQSKQILAKGLDYTVGSGKYGTVAKEPKITKNSDGTTTLDWDLLVNKSGLLDDISYQTSINPFALTQGVQSSLVVKNIVSSELDTRKENLRTSSQSITVLKVGMVGIYENINKQYGEKNSDFEIDLKPYTTIEEELDVKGITVLPQNNDDLGSKFTGTALLKNIVVTGGKPVTIWLNDKVVNPVNPQKILLTGSGGWYKYTGGTQNITKAKTLLFHVEGVLANTDDIHIKLGVQTKDNAFGDVYLNETVINSATDYKLSPVSNKVRYIIRADVELNLERIQIYTENMTNGLPVNVRINKELIKPTAVDEPLKLSIYNKTTGKKVFEKAFLVKDLLRENSLTIPANVLVGNKGSSNSYEVRVEGYNTDRVYVLPGTDKLDTLGYTASEKAITVNVPKDKPTSPIEYKGAVMTEREIGKDIATYNETLTIPIETTKPTTSGYGISLSKTVKYGNDLGNTALIQAQLEVDKRLADGNAGYTTDAKNANLKNIQMISQNESVSGKTTTQTMTLPRVYMDSITGDIISEKDVIEKNLSNVQDAGFKLYIPIWPDELGGFETHFMSTAPVGTNDVTFDIKDVIEVNSYMFGYLDSETLDKDALLVQPATDSTNQLFKER